MHKRLLCPGRRRQVPPHFGWIDHRFIGDGHISRCRPTAVALYLVLIAVGDAQGLSYYGDATLGRLLHLDAVSLAQARQNLIDNQLIVYDRPLYQVLDLSPLSPATARLPAASGPPPSPAPADIHAPIPPPHRSRDTTPISILIDRLIARTPSHD